MNINPKFARWFKDRDQQVLTAHFNRNRAALIKTIRELEAERDRARDYQSRLETLLESMKELQEKLEAEGGA
ncbi:MAG TPA: hypothetical protein ENF29_02375 [Candidatus Acetothermia bacterium]|jgi:ABC-type transporter Mla subunit MlaD|nr:hypothetical protein [Candidatus Bipolaricaulota bacterium]HDJ29881.1 hypothetical protein [Candidatus Acetothermia bacterium]